MNPTDPRKAPSDEVWFHPFVTGTDGVYCVHCSLPENNHRHLTAEQDAA